ncbi:hypothetical protein ACF1FX_32480 [Streptomyces sp. NPDC014646]|uniref:hypothetical protein n=1 Tax=Streptomyces sp. NPDC014646 TaxID=3364877 RepID=UPI0036F91C88
MSIMATLPRATVVGGLASTSVGATGICPVCRGDFESCRCRGFHPSTPAGPRAGWFEDEEQRDNDLGPMPDETELCRLVQHLVADGDAQALTAGRRARRTLAEMAPGHKRQPVLRLTRSLPMRAADGPCSLCDRWDCDPTNCPPRITPAPMLTALAGTGVAA